MSSFWGIVFLCKEYNLTRFNHQKPPLMLQEATAQGLDEVIASAAGTGGPVGSDEATPPKCAGGLGPRV